MQYARADAVDLYVADELESADRKHLLGIFDDTKTVIHRRAGSKVVLLEIPRIEGGATRIETSAVVYVFPQDPTRVELLVCEVGCFNALIQQEDLGGVVRIKCGSRQSETIPDPFRVVRLDDESQPHIRTFR